MTQHKQEFIVNGLREILSNKNVLHERCELVPYECDGLAAYRKIPLAVVLPDSIEQIQAVMRFCQQHKIPIVSRGAGTSLSGGALPCEDGIVLSLAKFNRILKIDQDNRTATVEPGVRNISISEAVKEFGFYYAPDPSSQLACTIGGNVAENSGGVHCLKYGVTVNNVLQVKLITTEGELVVLGSEALDAAGYDLLAVINGSEGMLGVIVEVVVKLLPIPEAVKVIMASFDSVIDAGDAVNRIISAGIIPAGLEMMDNMTICAAEDFLHAGYPTNAAAILLCELDGTLPEVEQTIGEVEKLCQEAKATNIELAKSEEERVRFWAGRKAAFAAVGRISPDYYCIDGTIKRRCLAEVLEKINQLSDQFKLKVANVFHAGDGNLHPLVLYDINKAGDLEKAEELGGKILELCVEVGGTITGEHGVGIEKINQMCVQFNDKELLQFHAVKKAFDPDGILNPGKAIPTLHRCAEFGAMHVHDNNLPHPELPRF
jgi:glycolate oxidase